VYLSGIEPDAFARVGEHDQRPIVVDAARFALLPYLA
jgi:hypothetical protein